LEEKCAALANLFGDVKEILGFKYRYFISSKGANFLNGFWQAKTVKPFYARQEQKPVFVR
ncbi:TPA: HNH endonuclease signature motif containing protein, partial [Salmonella enterica]